MSPAFLFLMSESIPFSPKISVNLVLLQIDLQLVVKEEYEYKGFSTWKGLCRETYIFMKIYKIEEELSGWKQLVLQIFVVFCTPPLQKKESTRKKVSTVYSICPNPPKLCLWRRLKRVGSFPHFFILISDSVQNIIFPSAHFISSHRPIAHNLGRRSCWVACLCVSDSDWSK